MAYLPFRSIVYLSLVIPIPLSFTSIAMPRATLKTNTVDGFSGMPAQPIIPAVINRGIILGIREQTNIRAERKRYNMHNAISEKAQRILSSSP